MSGNKRGRPSRGPRGLVWGRIPEEHHEAIERLMASGNAYKTDVVAALIAVGLQHLDEVDISRTTGEQEELPLASAS
jgi:hypothetical protein